MKRFIGIYAAAAVIVFSAFVFGSLSALQNSFLTEAAQSGMAEVMLGNLALQKAQSADVRQFAQRMVDEHTAANNELKQLAAGKNVALPADVSNKHRNAMNKLNGLSGAEFDREYMKQMVKDHEAAVKLFQRQSDRGDDADVKAFAAKTLPALQMHLQMARSMSDNMKNNRREGNQNRNENTSGNSNAGGNSNNRNSNTDRNMNANANMNSNSGQNTNGNMNSNSRQNTNGNTNSNANTNGNVNSL